MSLSVRNDDCVVRCARSCRGRWVWGLALLALSARAATAFDDAAVIYRQKCVSCHGAEGQGVADEFDEPLMGDLNVDELAHLIEETMPEEDPDDCVGEEAQRVARYVHHKFYSPEARQRMGQGRAPRIQLVRLTVPQHRNALADLIGQFAPPANKSRRGRREGQASADKGPAATVAGISGEYFQSEGMNKAEKLGLERVDHRLEFDFGEASPAEGIGADQFSIIWQGALTTRDTGYYEFRVRTQNGARLYLNFDSVGRRKKLRDDSSAAGKTALIDAWVSSGEMRETSARVFLLGGRQYPLRFEFFKYMEPTASVALEWKPPHGTWSVMDHRQLSTAIVPRTFVTETSFPADDRSEGYERGTSVSSQWHAAATHAAVDAAAEIVNRLPLLARFDDSTENREEVVEQFVLRLASTAFRRPLTLEEEQQFGGALLHDAENLDASVRRAVLVILTSPHFLYTDLTPIDQSPTQHAVAARLAFALWDSIPDKALTDAASKGQLGTSADIESQVQRMLADPRARAKMREFFQVWLELEERDLAKDKQMFPEFDEAVVADLRRSLELFVEQVVWSDASDYRQLLLADFLILNDRLAQLYRPPTDIEANASAEAETDSAAETRETSSTAGDEGPEPRFRAVEFTPGRRAGILTHPYLLSAFAYHNNTSPIHRGVFLTRNVMGRPLNPPPMAVAFKDDDFASDLTMRQKITLLTRDAACMSCHSVINPLGFALESYDAVGRWRSSDNNQLVNTKSEYTTTDGQTVEFQSARDIAEFAADSRSAHRAFVRQVFHHAVKQNPAAYGHGLMDQLQDQFAGDDFNVRNLLGSIAIVTATQSATATLDSGKEP